MNSINKGSLWLFNRHLLSVVSDLQMQFIISQKYLQKNSGQNILQLFAKYTLEIAYDIY